MDDQSYFLSEQEGRSIKDYINLIRNNFMPLLLITFIGLAISIIYALKAPNIYKATTTLKVYKSQGSILEAPGIPGFQDFGNDRFVENEIEVLKSITIREKVAQSLLNLYKNSNTKDSFNLILNNDFGKEKEISSPVKSIPEIIELLMSDVSIEQKTGLDIVDISSESPSPYESALIANEYAAAYNQLNLQTNRQQLTNIKNFLENQTNGKQKELNKSEDSLRNYQQKGGIIALDEQAKSLIDQLTNFEAQKNSANIELIVARKNLTQYREKLAQQDPQLADYLQSFAAEPYLKSLQEEIARLETKRDIALVTKGSDKTNSKSAVAEYDDKIKSLKEKVNEKMSVYKAGIFASSPEEVKAVTQKIIEEETKVQSATATLQELRSIVQSYDKRFNSLPRATIELAKLERNRTANEKMYLLLEQKYQEAIINEQSQPGNVLIIDYARIPYFPSKPNRPLIIIIGFMVGIGLGFGFILIKDFFDNTIKSPEDIQDKNINVLSCIPRIEGIGRKGNKAIEFIIEAQPDSVPSEAYRALRTRIQFSRVDKDAVKAILITSPAPQEGKTLTALNLAGSFAQAGKKTLLLDADIRKPRLHSIFKVNKIPGLTDYFFGKISLNDVLKSTGLKNLHLLTAGTNVPNPSEVLGSNKMMEFLNILRKEYDIVILDSAPIIPVTDSDILSRLVDATVLVVSANITEIDVMVKSVELLKHEQNTFIGVLLNNFNFKNGYSSYYKYYNYYSDSSEVGKKKSKK